MKDPSLVPRLTITLATSHVATELNASAAFASHSSSFATFSFPLHSLSPHQTFTDSSQEDLTNHFSQSASGSLASTFGDFHTPSQDSALKFLNAGSTAEGSSTKRSSLSPVKPVGSGFSSPSRVSAPLVQGPVFSTDTDTDPNTSETRFVCFDLIPEQWTQDSAEGCVLNRALEYTGLIGLIDTAVGSPSGTLFETVLTTVAFNFISHHEYFGADHTKVAPCLICPPRWSVRIATGLIGLLDLMVSPSNGSQPSTPSAEHNPWTFGSAMNAADFGECFDYDINAILDGEVTGLREIAVLDGEGVKNGEGSTFESWREKHESTLHVRGCREEQFLVKSSRNMERAASGSLE
ncbi:hypothetical protein D6C87_02444 [Aureobasidium pullulans]|nr:hypothetical protein D6C87_02444 [Aureobasidium pullulans]